MDGALNGRVSLSSHRETVLLPLLKLISGHLQPVLAYRAMQGRTERPRKVSPRDQASYSASRGISLAVGSSLREGGLCGVFISYESSSAPTQSGVGGRTSQRGGA